MHYMQRVLSYRREQSVLILHKYIHVIENDARELIQVPRSVEMQIFWPKCSRLVGVGCVPCWLAKRVYIFTLHGIGTALYYKLRNINLLRSGGLSQSITVSREVYIKHVSQTV